MSNFKGPDQRNSILSQARIVTLLCKCIASSISGITDIERAASCDLGKRPFSLDGYKYNETRQLSGEAPDCDRSFSSRQHTIVQIYLLTWL